MKKSCIDLDRFLLGACSASTFWPLFSQEAKVFSFKLKCKFPHSVLLWDLLISKIDRDMRPPAKLSYRSAIHKKVVFGSGDAWTLPQIQGEVGGDQEPPGNTWRYPMGSKIFLLILNHI